MSLSPWRQAFLLKFYHSWFDAIKTLHYFARNH